MTHEQAVQFLRQCGDVVKLRLYRDFAQTPVTALSPTETTPRASFSRKTHLRQEAVDMLNDLAVKKLMPASQDHYPRRSLSPTSSPRRLQKQACSSDASQNSETSSKYNSEEQFHEGMLQKCSLPFTEDSFHSLFIIDDGDDRPSRPSSLDLYNPNQTPVAMRKPKFNFSLAHNAYELNNLDPEILDAPNIKYNLGNEEVKSTEVECGDSFPQEPVSMPHIPHTDNRGFSHKNPAYQSAHPQCTVENGDIRGISKTASEGKGPLKSLDDGNMKKWKGVVLNNENDSKSEKEIKKKEVIKKSDMVESVVGEDYQVFSIFSNLFCFLHFLFKILAIELNRGWNSRLGFSLQGAAGVTYVSAVHPDSVAYKDGRIKPGDRVIKVNVHKNI